MLQRGEGCASPASHTQLRAAQLWFSPHFGLSQSLGGHQEEGEGSQCPTASHALCAHPNPLHTQQGCRESPWSAQHHTWPLQRPSLRGHLLEPQCHSTQLESPGHWEKDLQDILAGDGVWEHPEIPFSLCSITCSSAPHALGRTQLTHPLPPPLWASWLVPNGAN